jgi:hypothetical protein
VELRILGPLDLVVDGAVRTVPAGAERAVLELLLLNAGRVVPATTLVDALWGDDLPANAMNALQGRISRLRRALGDAGLPEALVTTRRPGYLADVDPERVDAHRFIRLVREALSFVLLMLAFRSVLVPLKAVLLNLLSIGAAYGVMVVVFQWGWGGALIGLETTVPIVSFIPMFLFAILFGLSMDYEVFLLSRVRDEYLRTDDNDKAIVQGISSTARTITSAALIMTAVFLSFAIADDPSTKMFGLGLAAAILIDATVVRMVLVPATMTLLGRANWWLPSWLDRVLPGRPAGTDAATVETHADPQVVARIREDPPSASGAGDRHHARGGADVRPVVGQGRGGEVRADPDGDLLAHRPGGRVEREERAAVVVDDPHRAAAHDW